MPRRARIIIPAIPHHVVQRGNHQQPVFFTPEDRKLYFRLLTKYSREFGIEIHAYCLMDNHVHLVAVPRDKKSFSAGLAEVHQIYSREIQARMKTTGRLWQGRFYSCPLDEPHYFASMKYVESNPVRAKIVSHPLEYLWSSANAHVRGLPDPWFEPLHLDLGVRDWSAYLDVPLDPEELKRFRKSFRTERPLGDEAFLEKLEGMTGTRLTPRRRGRPRKMVTPTNI